MRIRLLGPQRRCAPIPWNWPWICPRNRGMNPTERILAVKNRRHRASSSGLQLRLPLIVSTRTQDSGPGRTMPLFLEPSYAQSLTARRAHPASGVVHAHQLPMPFGRRLRSDRQWCRERPRRQRLRRLGLGWGFNKCRKLESQRRTGSRGRWHEWRGSLGCRPDQHVQRHPRHQRPRRCQHRRRIEQAQLVQPYRSRTGFLEQLVGSQPGCLPVGCRACPLCCQLDRLRPGAHWSRYIPSRIERLRPAHPLRDLHEHRALAHGPG